MRGRALRIDRERFRQLGERVVEFALTIINDPESGVGELVLRAAIAIAFFRVSSAALSLPLRKRTTPRLESE